MEIGAVSESVKLADKEEFCRLPCLVAGRLQIPRNVFIASLYLVVTSTYPFKQISESACQCVFCN